LSPSPFGFSSSVGGGSFPYLARYLAAYFSFRLGSQMKHCDLARSCSPHQSPFFLNSAATFGSHMLHSASGTPCSSHHQPLWSWALLSATCVAFG
jgi:hypothetical protein